MSTLAEFESNVEVEASVSFAIRPHLLKAMALLSSDDITRPALMGVCLDYSRDIPVLVSTDGRRLGVYSLIHEDPNGFLSPAKHKQFIIPNELIKKIPGTATKLRNADHVKITFSDGGVSIEGEPTIAPRIYYGYPNWRQIIPTDPPRPMDRFVADAEYVHDFQKLGSLLSLRKHSREYPILIPSGDPKYGIFSVYLNECPEFFGVLMGVRFTNSRSLTPPVYA